MAWATIYTTAKEILKWIQDRLNGEAHSIVPETDDTYNLGSTTKKFKNFYLGGIAYIDGLIAEEYLSVSKAVFLTNIITKTGAYTVTSEDRIILCDSSGGAFTLTLPEITGGLKGLILTFKKIDVSANAVTLDGHGTQTIDGALTNAEMDAQYDMLTIICDASNWHIIGRWIH